MTLPEPFPVRLEFFGDLQFFLRRDHRGQSMVRSLNEKTSIKDVIESCGVPHPEVDLILANGIPALFSHQLEQETALAVYPVATPLEFFPGDRLQARHLASFVADGHLGKLARDLRLLGFDVAYERNPTDAQLLETMSRERRALLTRDRRLLMHAVVQDGFYPRSQNPEEQTAEVLRRFELGRRVAPFTRCLACNIPLVSVPKADVFAQLEPLTKKYYQDFRRCPGCGKIYWPGSHFAKLQARITRLLAVQ
jgi:uncharacterized protein with PIN domain